MYHSVMLFAFSDNVTFLGFIETRKTDVILKISNINEINVL